MVENVIRRLWLAKSEREDHELNVGPFSLTQPNAIQHLIDQPGELAKRQI